MIGAAIAQGVIALFENIEFQFRRSHRLIAQRLCAGDLPFQDRAGGNGDFLMRVMVQHVAQHQCRADQPWHTAQGGKIRLHHIIAIALCPRGRGIACHCHHLHVSGKQVVAAVGFLIARIQKMRGMEPLANKTALHIGCSNHDGVNLARVKGCA